MAALHGFIDLFDDDTGNFEEQELIEQDDELATDKEDLEEIVTVSEYQELPPMNIMNIMPWRPVKKVPAKPMQPLSRPTLCYDKNQQSLPQELVNQSQHSAP